MHLVLCTEERHASQILAIFNEAIVNSTALYDYKPRAPETMVAWFAAKRANDFPVIGMEDGNGKLLGFASYGTFRAFPAYKYTVEHSVYVEKNSRGLGLGRKLLEAVIAKAEEQGMHALVGAIDLDNSVSMALHKRLGFEHCGTIRQAAFKFGRWLDLAFLQRTLATPLEPVDG
ncbi:N-acetyltransferase family protein [Polaromonas sp.]|uniref:GNAT family N-acetyltransferase n=1 Tax=Polaromonas sp. TaxID=1869339 RepID=UPI003C8A76A7